jgi:hypothetical protein
MIREVVHRSVRRLAHRIPPLRRLFDQRDSLLAENADLHRALAAPDRFLARQWEDHHPYRRGCQAAGRARRERLANGTEDRNLVSRIVAAYRRSVDEDSYAHDSWWRHARDRHHDLHEALLAEDLRRVATLLRHPERSSLLYGYELFAPDEGIIDREAWAQAHADRCKDLLVRLAEAVGVVHVENPEGGPWGQSMGLDTQELIARLERCLSLQLPIVPVQASFHGVAAGEGLITERMVHAAYCARRVRELLDRDQHPRVLEIGAGLGYVAYYASQLGIRDYTIVDLPMTNAAQAYFLGRSLGEDRLVLEGEEPDRAPAAVKIGPPRGIHEEATAFDLVLNVDSLTEVGATAADDYSDRILKLAPAFLSVNHEANTYTVRDLFAARGAVIERFPYWLRAGYVEEIIRPG